MFDNLAKLYKNLHNIFIIASSYMVFLTTPQKKLSNHRHDCKIEIKIEILLFSVQNLFLH